MSWAAIGSITRSEIRGAWRTLVLVGLIAGIAGSATLGALVVSRRTTTAYERLGTQTRGADAHGVALVDALVDDIVGLPSVAEEWTGRVGIAQIEDTFTFLGVIAGPSNRSAMLQPIVLDGRMPASTTGDVVEIALRDDFQRETGVAVGTKVSARFLTKADYFSFDSGFAGGRPNGPLLTLHVVGVVRAPGSLSSAPPTFAAPAALRDHPQAFEPGAMWFVRLGEGTRSVGAFAAEVEQLTAAYTLPPEASEFAATDVTRTEDAAKRVTHTADLLGRGLLVVAAAIAVAGLVAVAQALTRHHASRREHASVEAALGLTSTQQLVARLLAAVIPATIAGALTASAALWASGIEPLGAIRNYEPRPGVALNVGLLIVGVVVATAVILVLTAGTSLLVGRRPVVRPARASWLVAQASRLSRSTATVTGLRFALEPGRGRRSVPVRSAIAGGAVGIAGVVAGLVFTSSLDRLTSSPLRYGVPYDVLVSDVDEDALDTILAMPDAATVVRIEAAPLNLDGRTIPAYSLDERRGHLAIHLVDGRLPRTPDEIVIGLRLAHDLDKGIGDTVSARDDAGTTRPVAIVGTGVVPPFGVEELGFNAIMTREGLARVGTADPVSSAAVTTRAGSDPGALVDELSSSFETSGDPVLYEIDNLRQLGRLPATAAAAVGLIALIALANAVFTLVRRRRTELAVLRTIGFTARQTGASVLIMAIVMAAVGVMLGVPLGVAAGGLAWQLTAQGAFVATDALTPAALIAGVAFGAVLVALAAAVLPAMRARRIAPALLLHAE